MLAFIRMVCFVAIGQVGMRTNSILQNAASSIH